MFSLRYIRDSNSCTPMPLTCQATDSAVFWYCGLIHVANEKQRNLYFLESKPGISRNENFGIVSVTGFHLFREIHFLFLVWLHQHECDSFICIVDGPIYPFFYMNWASKEAPYCPAELGQCLLEICCIDCLNWAKYSCQTYLGYNIVSDSWGFFHY